MSFLFLFSNTVKTEERSKILCIDNSILYHDSIFIIFSDIFICVKSLSKKLLLFIHIFNILSSLFLVEMRLIEILSILLAMRK